MLSGGEAVAAGALDVDGKPATACDRCIGGDSDRAWWVDTRVVDVVAQVQASVAVEVVAAGPRQAAAVGALRTDRKSTRLNSSHANISYAVFCLKKKNKEWE